MAGHVRSLKKLEIYSREMLSGRFAVTRITSFGPSEIYGFRSADRLRTPSVNVSLGTLKPKYYIY
jgi:hypothetical protein